MKIPRWLLLATIVPILWGVGGALIEIPEKWVKPTFPSTLGYVVWSFTMALVAVLALGNIHWKVESDLRSVVYGCAVGFSGAAGQLLLFWVLTQGPAELRPNCPPEFVVARTTGIRRLYSLLKQH